MVLEVKEKGRLFSMSALRVRGSIERAAMTVTEDNFDAFSFFTDARPPAWNAIRLRRVLAKEDLTKRIGDEMATRPRRYVYFSQL